VYKFILAAVRADLQAVAGGVFPMEAARGSHWWNRGIRKRIKIP